MQEDLTGIVEMDQTPEFALLGNTFSFLDTQANNGLSSIQPNGPEFKSCIRILQKTMVKILNGLERDSTDTEREFIEFKISCYFTLIILKQHYTLNGSPIDCDPLTGNLPQINKSFLFSAVDSINVFKAVGLLPQPLQLKITTNIFEYLSAHCKNSEDFIKFTKFARHTEHLGIYNQIIALQNLTKCLETIPKICNSEESAVILYLMDLLIKMVDSKSLIKLPYPVAAYAKKAKLSYDWVLSSSGMDSQEIDISLQESFIMVCEKMSQAIMQLPASWFIQLSKVFIDFENIGIMEKEYVRTLTQKLMTIKNFLEYLSKKPEWKNQNMKTLEELILKCDSIFGDTGMRITEDQFKVHCQIINERLPNFKEHFIHVLNIRDLDSQMTVQWVDCIQSNQELLDDSFSVMTLLKLYMYLNGIQSVHKRELLNILEKSFKKLSAEEVNKIFKNESDIKGFPSDPMLHNSVSTMFNQLTEETQNNEIFPEFAWMSLNYPSQMVENAITSAVKHSGQTKPISRMLHSLSNLCKSKLDESLTLLESVLIKNLHPSMSDKECDNAKKLIKYLIFPPKNDSSLLEPTNLLKHFVIEPKKDLGPNTIFSIDMLCFILKISLSCDQQFNNADLFPLLVHLAYYLNVCRQFHAKNFNYVLSYKQKCIEAIETVMSLVLKQDCSQTELYFEWLKSHLCQLNWTIHLYIDSRLAGQSYCNLKLDTLSFVKACAVCNSLNVDNLMVDKVPYNEIVTCLVKVLPSSLLSEWKNVIHVIGELYKQHCVLPRQEDDCCERLFRTLCDVLHVSSVTQDEVILAHMAQCYCIVVKGLVSSDITSKYLLYIFMQLIELMKILPASSTKCVSVLILDILQMVDKRGICTQQFHKLNDSIKNLSDSQFSIIVKKWSNLSHNL